MIKFEQFLAKHKNLHVLAEEVIPTNIPLWSGKKVKKNKEKQDRHDLAMKDEFVEFTTENQFESTVEYVNLEDLCTYQSTLIKEKLDKFEKQYKEDKVIGKSLPTVYELETGELLLHDGNHRVAAAINQGLEEIECEVRRITDDDD